MRAVLPGKPHAGLQAVSTASWIGKRLVVYISGNAVVLLGGPHHLIQTIYQDEPDDLVAVAFDQATGKIATCSTKTIYIYRPLGYEADTLKWSLQLSFHLKDRQDTLGTLSWGLSEELLIGSSKLSLVQTAEEDSVIWSRALSSPVKIALFSYDANLIASTAKYDRLVKIWRRLSFGSDDVRFDHSYISHPATVISAQWRRPHDGEHEVDHVHFLYTVCADNKIRVWAATDPHGLQILQPWAEVDAQESIQPRGLKPSDHVNNRYIFIINSQDFSNAVQRAASKSKDGKGQSHALEHLGEIAKLQPEVCVVLDGDGHMSAWGLMNVGNKAPSSGNVFNVAHIENFHFSTPQALLRNTQCHKILTFYDEEPNQAYSVLVHSLDGTIAWLDGSIDEFFDPSPRGVHLHTRALWTGHDGPIKKIIRNVSGNAIISRTNDNMGLIWKQSLSKGEMVLTRCSTLNSPEHIHRTCLFADGHFIANLHHHSVSLWDSRGPEARPIATCKFDIDGKPLCLLQIPSPDDSSSTFLATITTQMRGIVWEVQLPTRVGLSSPQKSIMQQLCSFDLGPQRDLAYVVPIDPAGYTPTAPGSLDTFASDVAMSYTEAGVLRSWTAKLDVEKKEVNWLVTSTVQSGVDRPSLASGSSIRKIALVGLSRSDLTIWDSRSAQLEYTKQYDPIETIRDLDWTSTPDDQSILGVGFPHKVIVLAQIRYDYIEKGPAWAPIREIHIRESTPHLIGDGCWLGSGNLVIGVGNQLFIYDKLVTASDEMVKDLSFPTHRHTNMDLFDMVALLNGPLPVFHPQFLVQSLLAGKLAQVQKILTSLHKTLKYFTDNDEIDGFLGLPTAGFFSNPHELSLDAHREMQPPLADFDDEDTSVTGEIALALNEKIANLSIPYLSSQEQVYLADIVECVATAEKHRRSMDDNATRYLVFFRQHILRKAQEPESQLSITWREIAWAFHSGSQDILVDLVSRHFESKLLWEHAKESGMCMWITDLSALRAQFEVIARNEYMKTEERNPVDCSLYYLALKKKNVLLGLWRMATWNREQSATQRILSNDFQEPRWKTVGLDNAYALLGKRRFGYAAAFFLLAGSLSDAVRVCAQQLQDLQLAIAIARVYEGDDGPVLRELLEERVLPLAVHEGNRWLAMWAFWMLKRRDMAVRALISPIDTLVDSPGPPSQQARSYLATDPALVVLYKQLRDQTLQTLKGALQISPRAEWEFVVQTARLYDRMGCDLLALDLVRNWEFLKPQPWRTQEAAPADVPDPRKLLRRRSSLVVADLLPRSPRSPERMRSGGWVPSAVQGKVFEEPDSNSLLDSFGF